MTITARDVRGWKAEVRYCRHNVRVLENQAAVVDELIEALENYDIVCNGRYLPAVWRDPAVCLLATLPTDSQSPQTPD